MVSNGHKAVNEFEFSHHLTKLLSADSLDLGNDDNNPRASINSDQGGSTSSGDGNTGEKEIKSEEEKKKWSQMR